MPFVCPRPGEHPQTSMALPRGSPTLPRIQDPMSAPWSRQPVPQGHHSKACLQLPRALPCPAIGPLSWAHPWAYVPASACPCPQGGAQCHPGLGLSWCPPVLCSCRGLGQALAARSHGQPLSTWTPRQGATVALYMQTDSSLGPGYYMLTFE